MRSKHPLKSSLKDKKSKRFSVHKSLHSKETLCEFQKNVAKTFLECKLKQNQQKSILNLMRSHKCFASLSKDPRTVMQTPRKFTAKVKVVDPGEYMHLGVKKAFIEILERVPSHMIPFVLLADFNIDGCELNKKTETTLIQTKISNIEKSDVKVVGIYKGRHKPKDVDALLDDFIVEINCLKRDGLVYEEKKLTVIIRLGCLDLIARADMLLHIACTGFHACSRCKVIGFKYKRTTVFLGVNHPPRTDDEYSLAEGKHHKGQSPLLKIGMKLVTEIVIDGMHLLSNLHERILKSLMTGKYGKKCKLSSSQIEEVSKRITEISKYCPREFSRKPEILKYLKDFKATQHRQFLLYFGVAALRGIVSEEVYYHYLLLSAGMRCISLPRPSFDHLKFAKVAFDLFVVDAPFVYDLNFLSLNTHNLCHVVDDVIRFGPIDDYAAWNYENNMAFCKKIVAKPAQSFQQIHNRLDEKNRLESKEKKPYKSNDYMKLFNPCHGGPLPRDIPKNIYISWKMYSNLEYKNFTVGTNLRDSCCMLQDSSIGIVSNIFKTIEGRVLILIRKFCIIEDVYKIGIPSSLVGVFKCSLLSKDYELVDRIDVAKKCYRMPYWKDGYGTSSCSTCDEEDFIPDVFIVSVVI